MFSELFVLAHGEVFHVLDILYTMFWIFCIPCFGYFVFHVLDIRFHVLDIYQLSILMFTLL